MTRIVLHNHLPATRSIGRFRATAGVRDQSDCGCGCGGKGDCNQSHDASPLEKAKQNYLKQSDLLTKANKEVRELTANKQKTKALVTEVYNRYDKVKKDFEIARQELDRLERRGANDEQPGPDDYGMPKAMGPDAKFMGGRTARWNAFVNGKMLRRTDGAGRTWKTREGALAAAKAEMSTQRHDKFRNDFDRDPTKEEQRRMVEGSILRPRGRDKSGYATAELGIDVTWVKGGYGRPKISEARHYSVPNVTVDPRGHAPSGAFVSDQLRRQPEYASMVKSGWTADKIEGYYKREQRDVGRMV